MIQLQRASHGKQLNSLPSVFVNTWYKEKFNVLVDIPVTTQKSLLVFSLQKELKKREVFRRLSEKSYLTLIGIVSSSLGALDDKAMKKAISQSGLDISDDSVNMILTEIKREVTKQITGAGIASILVNDVLQAKMNRAERIKDLSFGQIVDTISRAQEVYGLFAQSESLAVVGEQITSMLTSVPLIKHLHDVWVTFNKHKSATVKGRLTYALDTMFEQTFGGNMIDVETKIPGIHYDITSVNLVKSLKYRQVVCTYFVSLRGLLGIESTEKDVSVKLSELLDHFLMNTPESLPSLPRELSCTAAEMKEGQDVFAKLWLMNAYEMILTSDEGQLAHQIMNVMNERKYLRSESWDRLIQEGISVISILFTAYIKTGAQFRDWSRDEDIYFAEDKALPYNVKLKLNKFVFDIVQGYTSFQKLEHPRFLNNPAHIVNYAEGQSLAAADVQYFIPDDQLKFNKVQWIITPDLERTLIYKNDKIAGTDLDLEIDINRRFLPMAYPIKPKLGFTVVRPVLFGGDISTAFLGIRNLEQMMRDTDIPSEIMRHSELVLIKDKVDFAEQFQLSEEIAEMLFTVPGLYASLANQSMIFFTWNYEIAPVVEFVAVDPSRDYIPFVGKYPYLLIYKNHLPSIAGLPNPKQKHIDLDPETDAKAKAAKEKALADEKKQKEEAEAAELEAKRKAEEEEKNKK